MPKTTEITNALYGAYRLALRDAGGMKFFDTSINGFWRSFFAALLIAPLYSALLSMRYRAGPADASLLRFITVEASAYVIAWVAFPLAMISLCRALKRDDRYLGFIVAYNWAEVLQNGVYLPISILTLAGVIPVPAGNMISLAVLIAILFYIWFIARTALNITAAQAVVIVALDSGLGILINGIAESMLI
jgi:hypothetical protein